MLGKNCGGLCKMTKYEGIDLLRKLCLAFGPTGCEDNVAELIKLQLDGSCTDIRTDRMGNIIAAVRGGGEGYNTDKPVKIMISAHMDEVGFMANEIGEDGYIKFACLGGIDPRVLCGRGVTLGDENNKVKGVIASKAIHLQSPEDRKSATQADKMYIDIGAYDREEALKYVSPGDFGTFDSDFVLFGSGERLVKCKAIDDRLGCTVMIEVMRLLAKEGKPLPFDLYFCFTVREEVGYSGAGTAANMISPDFSIVLEATAVADLADVPESSQAAKLGEGGAISLADRATIYDREFVNFALDTAKRKGIKAQIKKYVSGGNDAGVIHRSGTGVRTLAISAPTRYLHSASCVAAVSDFYAIEELVYAMLTNFGLLKETLKGNNHA